MTGWRIVLGLLLPILLVQIGFNGSPSIEPDKPDESYIPNGRPSSELVA
jgi:hypothetical protein